MLFFDTKAWRSVRDMNALCQPFAFLKEINTSLYRFYFSGSFGEALMIISFFDLLHKKNPTAYFELVVSKNFTLLNEILTEYPYISIVQYSFIDCATSSLKNLVRDSNSFLTQSFRAISPLLVLYSRIAAGRGEVKSFSNPNFFSRICRISHVPFNQKITMFQNYLNYTPELSGGGTPNIRFIPDKSVFLKNSIFEKRYIVLHMRGASDTRSFPPERWYWFVKHLMSEIDLPIILTGSEGDVVWIESALGNLITGNRLINLAGKLSFRGLATIISGARIYVGVDTGVTHLAGVLNVPSVVVGNQSNPVWLPTYNPNAIIVTEKKGCTCKGNKTGGCFDIIDNKRYYRCMVRVTNDSLIKIIRQCILSK